MNAAHKLGRIRNRLRRIDRRIVELYADKDQEGQVANEHKRDPVLHEIMSAINRRRDKELDGV